MKIIINGQEELLEPKQISILELLRLKNVQMPEMVSVELNDEIPDREVFGSTLLKDGDRIEFLYFMGGGALHPENEMVKCVEVTDVDAYRATVIKTILTRH